MALTRGGQIDEYRIYLYGKTNNDYRTENNPTVPLYLWELMDFGALPFAFYEKVKAAIHSVLADRGYDQYILGEEKMLYSDNVYLYLVKYGPEIEGEHKDRLLPLDVDNLGELGNPSLSQLVIIISNAGSTVNPHPAFITNPEEQNIQAGVYINVTAPGGATRRRRATRRMGRTRRQRRRN